MALFHHYTSLSNWLRGHDRYRGTFSKVLITRSSHKDAFYVLREGEDQRPGLEKARRLVGKLGIAGDQILKLTCELPVAGEAAGAEGLFAEPNQVTGTGIGWRWPRPEIPLLRVALVAEDGTESPTHQEDAHALAYKLDDSSMKPWADLTPRSFSVLPIAQACQAKCAFCFSKASASDVIQDAPMDFDRIAVAARRAALAGAERAVITGGGEPGVLRPERLLRLINILATTLGRVTLITNGWHLSKLTDGARGELLAAYEGAGLAVLSLSRHGLDSASNQQIMGLDAAAAAIFAAAARRAPALRRRLVCVLQKGGVEDGASVEAYLAEAVRLGAQEICFKELYVSSREESAFATRDENEYCKTHRAPLSMLVQALRTGGFEQISELPWGSPVFAGERLGARLTVAAYTEPSVGWERVNGLARSWNMLADGRVLASLEDLASEIAIDARGAT